jgi:hypothetical protein
MPSCYGRSGNRRAEEKMYNAVIIVESAKIIKKELQKE